jgi:hypothetical protein
MGNDKSPPIHLSGVTSRHVLLANIGLGQKCARVKNTLAYITMVSVMPKKSYKTGSLFCLSVIS